MKTSFYFVVWILIYPLLALMGVASDNSFAVAFAMVMGLSWLLKQSMSNITAYDRMLEISPILEDVYTGNVDSFRRRLTRMAVVEVITAAYFVVTVLTIGGELFYDAMELIPFAFFLFFALASGWRCVKIFRADSRLKANYCNEECLDIVDDTFGLDYEAYYNERINYESYAEMMSNKPRFFTLYRIFSLIMAIVASLLGLSFFLSGLFSLLGASIYTSTVAGSMIFLYGSLALYYGIKDIVACAKSPARAAAPKKIEAQ